jgi:hypothetical protein
MAKKDTRKNALIDKIDELPPEKLAVVEDFVDFLRGREDRQLVAAALRISEGPLKRIWDNADDAAYDKL